MKDSIQSDFICLWYNCNVLKGTKVVGLRKVRLLREVELNIMCSCIHLILHKELRFKAVQSSFICSTGRSKSSP
jgi:hypothetical protein